MPALAVALSSLLIYAAIGYAAFPGVSAFVLLFAIALHSGRTLAAGAFLATAAALVIATLLQPAGVVQTADALSIALATLVAWLAGENLRQRRNRWAALRERNEMLEREREERARQAVIAERLRIARELHDVVAHAMSVIAVQAGVGHHVAESQPRRRYARSRRSRPRAGRPSPRCADCWGCYARTGRRARRSRPLPVCRMFRR